jgi:hypothetical protein
MRLSQGWAAHPVESSCLVTAHHSLSTIHYPYPLSSIPYPPFTIHYPLSTIPIHSPATLPSTTLQSEPDLPPSAVCTVDHRDQGRANFLLSHFAAGLGWTGLDELFHAWKADGTSYLRQSIHARAETGTDEGRLGATLVRSEGPVRLLHCQRW